MSPPKFCQVIFVNFDIYFYYSLFSFCLTLLGGAELISALISSQFKNVGLVYQIPPSPMLQQILPTKILYNIRGQYHYCKVQFDEKLAYLLKYCLEKIA